MADELTLKQLYQLPENAASILGDKTFVGIDFGTSTTVVSVARYNEETKQIETEPLDLAQTMPDGAKVESYILPSVIAINDKGKLLVGQGAYALKGNPNYIFGENIWHSFKMELGKDMGPRWTSITKQSLIKSPQDATSVFFRYLKKQIENAVAANGWSPNIQYAVSIPASFESNQRLDLLRALYNNGIDMESGNLIDEPNAAFISYITPDYTAKDPIILRSGYNPKVLVFDFGAGTCDISILELSADYKGYHSKNISISQFTELGGNDMDRYITYNYLLPEILKKNGHSQDEYTTQQLTIIANQLLGIAEQLKVLSSKDFQYLLTDEEAFLAATENGQGVTYKKEVCIYTDYGDLVQDTFFFPYSQFVMTMGAFFDKHACQSHVIKYQKKYNSIYATIDSAVEKAHIDKYEVDYVLMVGGSSKNPYVQDTLKRYFNKKTTVLIPSELQTLVSQGAAIHSLLVNGLGYTIVKPITSEPIVAVIRGDVTLPIIPAGTEIPVPKVKTDEFSTGEHEQSTIEIPICVGSAEKVVANVIISDPMGLPFPKHTSIEVSVEMNADKVLEVTAKCLGQECVIKSENPFANTYLTDEEKRILEAERNTYVSADKNNGIPTKQSFEDLYKAYDDADKEFQAAETYEQMIKYYPQDNLYNLIGVLYHNSGNYTKAIRFFRKALTKSPNSSTVLSNLGHDLYIIGENGNAKNYLQNAISMQADNTTALSKLGDICRDEGDKEQAHEYYERCFNIYMRKWNDDDLSEVDYGWFQNVAEKLGKGDFAAEIRARKPKKKVCQAFNSDNLITIEKKDKDEEEE